MKSLASFKMCVTLVGLAAGLVFSPACKAQSEIAPDHFDGTDSWEAAAHRKATRSKSPLKRLVAETNRSPSSPTIPYKHRVVAQNLRETTVMQ